MEKDFNGWSNYETWAVYVWMENEEMNYRYLMELVEDARTETSPAAYLASKIKETVEDGRPETGGLYKDLLTNAIESVDYYEIAESLLSD